MSQQRLLPMGPTKVLSREQAIEEYVVLRMRAEELARLDFLLKGLKNKVIGLPQDSPFTHADLADTIRTAFVGWFATLTDKHSKAIYSFNCLYALFPHRRTQILMVQQSLESCSPELREFRNNVAFHPRAVVADHIKARQALRGTDAFLDFVGAVSDFGNLLRVLEEEELDIVPELPAVLVQLGVEHLPAFARLMARAEQSRQFDWNADSLLPDSCQLLP